MPKYTALPYASMAGFVAPGDKVIRLVASGPLVVSTVTESAPLTGRLRAVRLAPVGWLWYEIAVQRIHTGPVAARQRRRAFLSRHDQLGGTRTGSRRRRAAPAGSFAGASEPWRSISDR